MKLRWNGVNSIISGIVFVLLGVVSGGCDEPPQDAFFTYQGYRDWWRIPLKYPYQIIVIDTFNAGTIDKYDEGKDIANPNVTSVTSVADIIAVCPRDEYIIFRRKSDCGIFVYNTAETVLFLTEHELSAYLASHYPNGQTLDFQSLESFYDAAWASLRN